MDYNLERKKTPKATTPVQTAKPAPAKPSSPVAKQGGAAKKPEAKAAKAETEQKQYKAKEYSDTDIISMLEGYINVNKQLWDHVPVGAHVRYIKVDKDGTPRNKRFKPGGFVKNRYTNEEGKQFFMLETNPNGKRGDPGYTMFPVAFEDVEELWKKYDRGAFIEIHLITASLMQKRQQIEELQSEVRKLKAAVAALTNTKR